MIISDNLWMIPCDFRSVYYVFFLRGRSMVFKHQVDMSNSPLNGLHSHEQFQDISTGFWFGVFHVWEARDSQTSNTIYDIWVFFSKNGIDQGQDGAIMMIFHDIARNSNHYPCLVCKWSIPDIPSIFKLIHQNTKEYP